MALLKSEQDQFLLHPAIRKKMVLSGLQRTVNAADNQGNGEKAEDGENEKEGEKANKSCGVFSILFSRFQFDRKVFRLLDSQ